MRTRDEQREDAITRMADFVLAEGLGAATLRPLANAAGISDRMLLYYFKDKDEVITAILHRLAERMTTELDQAFVGKKRLPFARLLAEVWSVLASESLKPFMPLWLDLAAGAARGRQPHLQIAGQIADAYLEWISSHLSMSAGRDHATETARFMVTIEGMYLMQAVGRGEIALPSVKNATKQ